MEYKYFPEGVWVVLDENSRSIHNIARHYRKFYLIPKQVIRSENGELIVRRSYNGFLPATNEYFKFYIDVNITYEDVE